MRTVLLTKKNALTISDIKLAIDDNLIFNPEIIQHEYNSEYVSFEEFEADNGSLYLEKMSKILSKKYPLKDIIIQESTLRKLGNNSFYSLLYFCYIIDSNGSISEIINKRFDISSISSVITFRDVYDLNHHLFNPVNLLVQSVNF